MKLFLLAISVPFVLSGKTPTFKAITNTVDNDLNLLGTAISNLQVFAKKLGHKKIANKCNDALQQLSGAQNSWSGVFAGFSAKPWLAGSSRLAGNIQSRMDAVEANLLWMFQQSECKSPVYKPYVTACQAILNSCQSGCGTVWAWPKQPNTPKPSQAAHSDYYRRHRREATLCPSSETACPISPDTPGIECIDTQSELTSCGGCVTKGEGENCLSILGADAVGCNFGSCVVFSVNPGFLLNNITGRPEVKAQRML